MADFSSDVSAWCDRAGSRATALFRAIAFDAVAKVQSLTPVDTGFLRSNWTCLLPSDPEPVAGRVPPAAAAIERAAVGQVLIILNPVAYARRVEYGFVGEDSLGRHFNQQGRHMMAQTIAEMPAIAQAAYARVVGGGP
jgi:hypothetical protein